MANLLGTKGMIGIGSTEDGSDQDSFSRGSSASYSNPGVQYEASESPDQYSELQEAWSTRESTQASSKLILCRWHKSAGTVGSISADGHTFKKTASGQKVVINDRGTPMELSSICMVFDSTLRCGGLHTYQYTIVDGELGPADGAGFVFDSKVRRNNIQQMRTVFLNKRGVICIRDRHNVRKLTAQLPPLEPGLCLSLTVDLDNSQLQFVISSHEGVLGFAEVQLDCLFDLSMKASFQSGFFCAVVTKEITVSLW